MPDDVEGKPFPDGWEPDDDRGGADEDFAAVVFDEAFVKAADIHEPSAVERLLAAAEARADADAAARARARRRPDDEPYDPLDPRDPYAPYGLGGHSDGEGRDTCADGVFVGPYGPYGRHGGAMRPYRNSARWHRPVAWLLALLMGIGIIAFAYSAVYRGASDSRDGQAPAPASTEVDNPTPGSAATTGTTGGVPSVSAEYRAPAASAQPRTP
ncbi:hypothetical protein ACIQM4_16880 [Streptomyces sp. NPDC091272]|uniref:SCO2584 family spore wall biosynthesis protein n=1 Tax=Streptomyces sp. NPDC091272 TaxID=3365981 RepID=UPI003800E440